MNKKINNKTAFTVYSWTSSILFTIMLLILIIVSLSVIGGYKFLIPDQISIIIFPLVAAVLFRLIDIIIKPAYFEADISYESICIKTYNPDIKNRSRFLFMPLFRKHLKVYTIDRHSYNNYRILIERSGIRKSLVLQKIENGKLYESQPVNISFLGAQKYTDLIIAMDRLREKISLN